MRSPIIFLIAGAAMLAIAALDPDFVMNGWRVRSLVGLIGRTGTRILYAVIGIGLLAAGGFMLVRGAG